MIQSKAEAIVVRLLTNAADLKYGLVSVTAKIHDGRVVEVIYSTTESTREELREKVEQIPTEAK
jgi:hypothetical protein